jgi:chromosome segregation ATPase
MMLAMQILVALGVGLVIYAVFGVATSGTVKTSGKPKPQNPFLHPVEDTNKEQKIQRLQTQVSNLESQVEQVQASSVDEKSELAALKEKETEFSVELKRREEWVAKAEAELAKIKSENLDLSRKFTAKEKELQEEFTKNVNLTREMREIKSALDAKEMACRLKEDQVQAQKHQIESQLKSISDSAAAIAEFNRKEKISEWVPKLEFNKLNEEYTKLEKDLEATQERLKSFAAEIAHLRQAAGKKDPLTEEVKLPEIVLEKAKLETLAPNEKPIGEVKLEEAKPKEIADEGLKPQKLAPEEIQPPKNISEKAQKEEAGPKEMASEEIKPQKPAPEEVKLLDAALIEVKTEVTKPAESKAIDEIKAVEKINIVKETKEEEK